MKTMRIIAAVALVTLFAGCGGTTSASSTAPATKAVAAAVNERPDGARADLIRLALKGML